MSNRLDLIILGATGYTGKHVVKNVCIFLKEAEYSGLKCGLAGRSKDKMKKLKTEMKKSGFDISDFTELLCDIKNEETLISTVAKTKVIVNCTGPHILLSGPVIKACISTGTHYVDISAELYHIMDIYEKYNDTAEKSGVLIVPACGFAAIPTTAGLIHLQNTFKGTLHSVECYVVLTFPQGALTPGPNKCLVHYGTWESLVHELRNLKKFYQLRDKVFTNIEPTPREVQRSFFHRKEGRIWYPYPGPDQNIVEISQAHYRKRGLPAYYFKSYTTMPSFFHLIIIPVFFLYYYLSVFQCFMKLLLRFPRAFTLGYFSHQGPSERMRNELKYSFTLQGKGMENNESGQGKESSKTLTAKVSGNDPGYRTTAICVICSALTILKERDSMPEGGVHTSAVAFQNTQIVNRLKNCGMNIEIINNCDTDNGI